MNIQSKYSQCINELSSGQKIKLSESATFIYINAANNVEIVKVDKCIIPENIQNQLGCDYLVLDKNLCISRFIELKGEDVKHACNQINDTISYFEQDDVLKEAVINMNQLLGYIVSPHCHVPDINYACRKKLCRKLYDKSRDKRSSPDDHLLFIKCVSKNPGKVKSGNTLVNSYNNPLKV